MQRYQACARRTQKTLFGQGYFYCCRSVLEVIFGGFAALYQCGNEPMAGWFSALCWWCLSQSCFLSCALVQIQKHSPAFTTAGTCMTAYICPTLLFKPTLVFYRRCYSIHFLHHLSSFNTMNQIYMRMFISLLSPGFFLMLRFYMLQWITKRGGGSSLGSSSIGSTRQHMLQTQEKS